MSLEWRGAAVVPDGERPSPDEWEPVTVPGRPAQFAGADAVAYETTFRDPREADEEHVVLVLGGTYAHTRVWCNGEQVVDHDAYFAPLRVPLPDAEEYEVVVECRTPDDRFGGLHDTDALPEERCAPGIWWRAELQTRPDPYVESLRATPRLTEDGAAVDVTATVVTDEAIDDRLTFSLRPAGDVRGGGMMDRSRVATGSGHATVQHTIDVRDPSLWEPKDRGSQPQYVVRAKIGDDEHSVRTGLRSIEYDGEDGFHVNGKRVPARGVTLLDPTPDDVERAADANANLVRIRAQAAPPAVLDACDEHGLLVWQDLPLTGPGGFDADRGADLATALEQAYSRHPSLAAVGVHDEPVTPYADGLGSGLLDRLRFRWRAWRAEYDAGPAREVADAVDDVPTFPVIGPPGIDPDAATLYPGWQYGDVDDLAWLCDRYSVGDVVAGFGAASLGADEPTDETGFDRATHDARVDGGATASQAYHARVVRTVADRLRERETHLLSVDCLRDVADAGPGLLTATGAEKAAYEALSSSYEPTQILLADPSPGESDVVVCHDRPTGTTLTVEWDHDGEREQAEHTVSAFARVTVGSLDLAAGETVTLAVAVDGTVVKNEYEIGT